MTSHLTPHLTHEQLCDILLACAPHPLSSDYAALQQHLRSCPACSDEIARLDHSLKLFREASTTHARQQLVEIHANQAACHSSVLPSPRTVSRPLYWACAAALALTVLAPLGLRHRHVTPSPSPAAVNAPARTQESDEALLEEINQDLSAAVPSPMRPLDDPAASSTRSASGSGGNKQTREN
ncbi:hypothetical protein [Edaphobacter bradus]|uniref:hypothetical protein n=1 Tax=Edaphobacter bradus TaxID=2259016 RepID=UPI0021DFE4B9|nr:hypothetical protein [Edaphobacter bradus]